MRLFSTPGSVRRGELSILAIAETIAASGLSFWLAWRLGSIRHILLASALAPFLLLRTPLSTWYAIRLYKDIGGWLTIRFPTVLGAGHGHKGLADLLVLLSPAPIFITWIATTAIFLLRPLQCMRSIPANFFKYVAVVDFALAPHIFAGSEELRHKLAISDLRQLMKKIYLLSMSVGRRYERGLSAIAFILVFVPVTIFTVVYRWALKSTAVLWLPLIWIVIQARPGTQVMERLAVMTRSAWFKAMLVYSALVLLAFVAKLALLFGIWHFAGLNWLGPLGVAATRLVAPFELPLWQVAGATNALLAWLFFFHADQHLLVQGTSEAWPEVWVRREYAFFQAVRTTLSLYVIACTFYIASAVGWQTEWPPIRFVLFPWSA